MANLKGTGVPTRKTVGAIGDIYTDTTTGKQYKCTFAYRTGRDEKFDCQWAEEKGKKADVKPEPVMEKKVEEKPTVTPKPETKEPPKQNTNSNRTNYASYNKKQN